MSDLLGSILDKMTAPPSTEDKDSIRRRKALKRKREEEVKKRREQVQKIEAIVEKFALGAEKEFSFQPSEKEWRAIQHEVAEIAGLVSVSCYNGPQKDKHVTLFKKDSLPSEEDLKKRRLGEKYINGYSGKTAAPSSTEEEEGGRSVVVPNRNYQDKYKRILEKTERIVDTRSYHGLVPMHMLCEPKTIEESMSEIREKRKRQKMGGEDCASSADQDSHPASSHCASLT